MQGDQCKYPALVKIGHCPEIHISIKFNSKRILSYYIIAHPILARGPCISAREPLDSKTDIEWPRASIRCDIKMSCHDFYILS